MARITLREWIKEYNNVDFSSGDIETQCNAGWIDWFCSDADLEEKLHKIASIITCIDNDFILDNYYIWLKNSCPIYFPLYDEVRFEPMQRKMRDKWFFGIQFDHPNGCRDEFVIFTARNDFKDEYECNDRADILSYINQLADDFENRTEKIKWTFFVLDFDNTFDNEEPDSLDCTPLVFMVPENKINIVKNLAYKAHDKFHEDEDGNVCIADYFTDFLVKNNVKYMEIGTITLRFIERHCNYLADGIHTVSI